MVDCLLVLLNILADQLKDIVLDLHRLVIVEQFRENPEHPSNDFSLENSSQLKAMGIFSSVSLENDGKAKLKNGCWCRHSFEPVGHSLIRLVIMMMLLNRHHHYDDDATLLNHD